MKTRKKRTLAFRLTLAVEAGNVDEVAELLKKGANPDQEAPLRTAIDHCKKNPVVGEKLLKLLLDYHADPLLEVEEDEDTHDYSGYDDALCYALGEDCSFACFKLLYDSIQTQGKPLTEDHLHWAAQAFDSHIIIFLIEKNHYRTYANPALENRLEIYFEDPDFEKEYLLTPFYFSIQLLVATIKQNNLEEPPPQTLCQLFKLAIIHHDVAFAHEVIQHIPLARLKEEKLYLIHEKPIFSFFIKPSSNIVLHRSHLFAMMLYLLRDPAYLTHEPFGKIKEKASAFFEKEILIHLYSSKSEIRSLASFTYWVVNYLKNSMNPLLSAFSDKEINDLIADIILKRYSEQREAFKTWLLQILKIQWSLTKNEYDALLGCVMKCLEFNQPLPSPIQQQNLLEILKKIKPFQPSPADFFRQFTLSIQHWKLNYLTQDSTVNSLSLEQTIQKDYTFCLHLLSYYIRERNQTECTYILSTDFIQLKTYHERSPQWLINYIRNVSSDINHRNLIQLTHADEIWFLEQLLIKKLLPRSPAPKNRLGSSQLIDRFSESQKNLFLRALVRHRTKKTLQKLDPNVPKQTSLYAISQKNYRDLIRELREMNVLPRELRETFLKSKGNYTLLNMSEPEILTSQEKIIYHTLITTSWKISHRVASSIDLEKIRLDGWIYSILARKVKNIPIDRQHSPEEIPHFRGVSFLTVGPKTPIPPFLRNATAIENDVDELLRVHPHFFENAQVTFHYNAFRDNQTFTPTNYAGSSVFVYHKNNTRYTKFILPNETSFIESKTFSEGFFVGERIVHILILFFILKLRYVGGNFYQLVIDHPTDLELLKKSFVEMLHTGILELQYLLAVPLDERYTHFIPPPKKRFASEIQIQTALQNITNLQAFIHQGGDLSQDVMVNIQGYSRIGNLLTRAIAENKPDDMIDLLLQHTTTEINFNFDHNKTLWLALHTRDDNKLQEKIVTHHFLISSLPHTYHVLIPDFNTLFNCILNLSISTLSDLIHFYPHPSQFSEALQQAIGMWANNKASNTLIKNMLALLFKHGVNPLDTFLCLLKRNHIEYAAIILELFPNLTLSPDEIKNALHLVFDRKKEVFNFVYHHFITPSLLTNPIILSILVLLGISNDHEYFKKMLKDIEVDRHEVIDSANHLDLIPLLSKIVARYFSQEDIDVLMIHINNYICDYFGRIDNFNQSALIAFVHSLNPTNWFAECKKHPVLFCLLSKLLDSEDDVFEYVIGSSLQVNPDEKWQSLATTLTAISDACPVFLSSEAALLKGAAVLSSYPEAIPFLISIAGDFEMASKEKLVQIMIFILQIHPNYKSIIHQVSILDTLDKEDAILDLVDDAPPNLFLLIATCLILSMDNTAALFNIINPINDYIKNHADEFNQLEKYFDIPAFTVNKLKILFHQLNPNQFPLLTLSAADQSWGALLGVIPKFGEYKMWDYFFDASCIKYTSVRFIGVAFITCQINHEKYIYLGNKKSFRNDLTLLAPGGFINNNEDMFRGTLREIYEETGFDIKAVTNLTHILPNGSYNITWFEELGRLDLIYPEKNAHVIVRNLFEYAHPDPYNRTNTMTHYTIQFYWFDFDTDLSQELSAKDDFANGQWIPLKDIIFDSEKRKFYYHHTEVAASNALLIERIKGHLIPQTTIREAIYEERYVRHQQRDNLLPFFARPRDKNNAQPTPDIPLHLALRKP